MISLCKTSLRNNIVYEYYSSNVSRETKNYTNVINSLYQLEADLSVPLLHPLHVIDRSTKNATTNWWPLGPRSILPCQLEIPCNVIEYPCANVAIHCRICTCLLLSCAFAY